MKKLTKILSSIALVFVLMLTTTVFVACGSKDEDPKPVDVRNSKYIVADKGFYIEWLGNVTTSEKIGHLEYWNHVEYDGIYGNKDSENQFITEQENKICNDAIKYVRNQSITFNQDGTVYFTDETTGETIIDSYLQSEDKKTISLGSTDGYIEYKNNQYYLVSDYLLRNSEGNVLDGNKKMSFNYALSYVGTGAYYGEPTTAYSVKKSDFAHSETGIKLAWADGTTAEEKQTVYSSLNASNAMEFASKFEENLESEDLAIFVDFDDETNGVARLCYEQTTNRVDKNYYYEQSTDLKTIKFYEDADHYEQVEIYSLEFDNNQFWLNVKYNDKLTIKISLTRTDFVVENN